MTSRRNRMTRRWMSWNSGAEQLTLAAAATARVLIPTLLEAELGREIAKYTVVRTLMSLTLRASTGQSAIAVGIMMHNKNISLGQIDPTDDPHGDWLYLEQWSVDTTKNIFFRDVAGKRMSRGQEQEQFLYIRNRDAVSDIFFFASGRTLVLTD